MMITFISCSPKDEIEEIIEEEIVDEEICKCYRFSTTYLKLGTVKISETLLYDVKEGPGICDLEGQFWDKAQRWYDDETKLPAFNNEKYFITINCVKISDDNNEPIIPIN